MKKIILLAAITAIGVSSFAQPIKKSFTQTEWETFLDASRNYAIAKLTNAPDTAAKFSSMIAAKNVTNGYTQSQLEDKMEEFYGPNWKNAAGPIYTACWVLCGISFSVCFDTIFPIWDIDKCSKRYESCLRMCSILPPGL
jgi:hypothetical protein